MMCMGSWMTESTPPDGGAVIAVKTHFNTAKIPCRWAISILFPIGLMFITRADHHPKYCYWESGKEPLYFQSKRTADDYAFGMAANGYPVVVMEIPAAFDLRNKEGEACAETADHSKQHQHSADQ